VAWVTRDLIVLIFMSINREEKQASRRGIVVWQKPME
jgi:hypothetical protein